MSQIFDFHARLGSGPGAMDRLRTTMDAWGIDGAVVSAGGMIDVDRLSTQIIEGGQVETDADNEAVLAGCRRYPARLLPFFFGNPHREPDSYRGRAGEFRGLEISPAVHGVPLTDERTTALVEVAEEIGHPVYVVCLGRPGAGAVDLVTLAGKFPDVTFVLGHCGFIGIDTYAVNKIAAVDNIVAETSGSYTGIVRIALERLGSGRVLFGTEYPLQHPSVELAKLRALELSPDVWRDVMWRNAQRVLGEEQS